MRYLYIAYVEILDRKLKLTLIMYEKIKALPYQIFYTKYLNSTGY